MEIRAAVVHETAGKFSLEQLELCDPKDDEVLVRIAGVGICHTDLAARDGHLPIPPPPSVFGHEGAGVVERVGARVTKVAPGDHVVLAWDYCGVCPACKAGKELYCLNFFLHNFHGARPDGTTTLSQGDGAIHGSFFCQSSFADFALANERNVVKVRTDVPLEILGPLGCGVMTGAGAVMNALRPRPGASIAIFGVGPVGMSAVLGAGVCGCTTIIAVDLHPDRLAMARQFGATHTLNAAKVDPVEAIREITGGGAEFSLECVGNPSVGAASASTRSIPSSPPTGLPTSWAWTPFPQASPWLSPWSCLRRGFSRWRTPTASTCVSATTKCTQSGHQHSHAGNPRRGRVRRSLWRDGPDRGRHGLLGGHGHQGVLPGYEGSAAHREPQGAAAEL